MATHCGKESAQKYDWNADVQSDAPEDGNSRLSRVVRSVNACPRRRAAVSAVQARASEQHARPTRACRTWLAQAHAGKTRRRRQCRRSTSRDQSARCCQTVAAKNGAQYDAQRRGAPVCSASRRRSRSRLAPRQAAPRTPDASKRRVSCRRLRSGATTPPRKKGEPGMSTARFG